MSFDIHPSHRRSIWQLPLLALLMIMLFTGLTSVPSAVASDQDIIGTVTASPGTADGIGLWQVVDDGGRAHTVRADSETKFDDGLPQIGDRVEVIVETAEEVPLVSDIKRIADDGEDDGGGADGDEAEGQVVARPGVSSGIGTWLIQTDLFVTQTVIADVNTQFDDGIPAVGDWVEAKGSRQIDGSILAERIRPDEYEDGELVIWLKPGVLTSTIESRYGIEAKSGLLSSANIYLFGTEDDDEPGLIETIRTDDDVVWAELNYVQGIPEDDGYSTWSWGGVDPTGYQNQQAFEQVNLNTVQDRFRGDGVVVAVLDTGVYLDHPALAPQILPGYDVVADDTVPQDEPGGVAWGHGTHVAGIIAHIAPNAKIIPVRVLDSNGRGNTFLLAYAVDWAMRQHVDVISLSLGTDTDSLIVREKIDEATNADIVVVAAAGNQNDETIRYPAGYDGVVSVTAVDGGKVKADFASYGTWVDISAPGVAITSTVIGPDGPGYASWTGTSMATPFVSGAAALVRQAYPAYSGPMVVDRLISAAGNIDPINPGYEGKLGGLTNIGAALPPLVDDPQHALYLPILQ